MAKRGPKPLPPGEAKDRQMPLRVSAEEHATLTEAARRAGKSWGEWAREVLLAAAERI